MSNRVDFEIRDDRIKDTIDEMHTRVEAALEAVGLHLEGEAAEELENDPVRHDTGFLKNSITHALSGQTAYMDAYKDDNDEKYGYYEGTAPDDPENQQAVYIGTNVEYAEYVHDGTYKMAPNRFLKNAVERNEAQVKKIIQEALK